VEGIPHPNPLLLKERGPPFPFLLNKEEVACPPARRGWRCKGGGGKMK